VATVIPFDTEADAVALANDSIYGLSGSLWTRDLGRSIRMAKAVRTGVLSVNPNSSVHQEAPVGGYKQSGVGREGGPLRGVGLPRAQPRPRAARGAAGRSSAAGGRSSTGQGDGTPTWVSLSVPADDPHLKVSLREQFGIELLAPINPRRRQPIRGELPRGIDHLTPRGVPVCEAGYPFARLGFRHARELFLVRPAPAAGGKSGGRSAPWWAGMWRRCC